MVLSMRSQCLGWEKTVLFNVDAALAHGTGSVAADLGHGEASAWGARTSRTAPSQLTGMRQSLSATLG